MRKPSWPLMAGMSLALLCGGGACTNGGKNLRDSAGMTPGSASGQVGGAAPAGATTGTTPATPAAADSITSRRDTLGGRMAHMVPGAARRDTAPNRRRP